MKCYCYKSKLEDTFRQHPERKSLGVCVGENPGTFAGAIFRGNSRNFNFQVYIYVSNFPLMYLSGSNFFFKQCKRIYFRI